MGEILDGELIVHPRPDPPHTQAASALTGFLFAPFWRGIGGPGGWISLAEPKIRFGSQILVPDLAGWRKERFAAPPRGPYLVTPDWVCEILSLSTQRFDRALKLPLYAHEGVGHAWLLDPVLRTLEVLRRHEGKWLIVETFEREGAVRAEPFAEVELDLALIWGPPVRGEIEGDEPSRQGKQIAALVGEALTEYLDDRSALLGPAGVVAESWGVLRVSRGAGPAGVGGTRGVA
jgi:Uma2 family endonuclease